VPEDFNATMIGNFRANGGDVGPPFGKALVLVHHTGARSGVARVTPLAALPEDGGYLIVASKAGAPDNPAWYYNLLAHPDTEIEVPGDGEVRTLAVRASELTGAERDAAFARIVEAMPGFGDYARKTAGIRTIPVVALTPV
jgi:deazaflavin-dependent oxidoreductase (nitroreductase family)